MALACSGYIGTVSRERPIVGVGCLPLNRDMVVPALVERAAILVVESEFADRRQPDNAPTTNMLLSISSPARVITPSLTLPAVEWSLGACCIHWSDATRSVFPRRFSFR